MQYKQLRNYTHSHFYLLPPTKEEVRVFARVCLSVSLSVCLSVSTITQKRVHGWIDRCRNTDQLINF